MKPDHRKKAFRVCGPILLITVFAMFSAFIYALVLIAQALIGKGGP